MFTVPRLEANIILFNPESGKMEQLFNPKPRDRTQNRELGTMII